MKKKIAADAIDLAEVILIIWNNKIKVILIVILTVVVTLNIKVKEVTTSLIVSKTKSISSFDAIDYNYYNFIRTKQIFNFDRNTSFDRQDSIVLKIDKYFLFDLFMEFLKEESIKKEIVELNIIKREDYKNEKEYLYAIDQFVSSIGIRKKENGIEGTIEFKAYTIQERKDWEKILSSLESSTNKLVQKYLKVNINKEMINMLTLKKIMVEDASIEIESTTKLFKKSLDNRIFFLEQQADLALSNDIIQPSILSIKENLEIYNNGNIDIFNDYNQSYYLRGYNIIKKEIEFYKNEGRELRFSARINSLKEKKSKLENDISIKRLEDALRLTPIFKEDNFLAGTILIGKTSKKRAKIDMSKTIKITIAILIGMIIGSCYVLTEKLLFNRKKQS